MIRVYTAPGSRSGRNVIKWLKEHNLSFIEKQFYIASICVNKEEEVNKFSL